MDQLERGRLVIDACDREMAELFCRRMEAVRGIAEYKKEHGLAIYVPEREQEVLAKNAARIEDPALRGYYEEVLKRMMEVSRKYQMELIEE